MASGWFTAAIEALGAKELDLENDSLVVMIVDDEYVFDPDQEAVDENDASDLASHELVATNYTGGHEGAGRKAATITAAKDDANNRMVWALADLTWTALGGAVNGDIGGFVLLKPGTSDDSDALPIAFFQATSTRTNGSDVTADFLALGSGGNLRIAV